MSFDVIKQSLKWLDQVNKSNKKTLGISFFGGEPLLEWEKITMTVDYARKNFPKNRFSFSVTTNTTLLDREKIEYCKRNRVMILVSTDGIREAQNTHRLKKDGSGSFDDMVDNMKLAFKENIAKTARLTYTPKTLPYLYESVKFLAEEVGAGNIAPTSADGFIEFSDEDLKEWDRQYEKINEYARKELDEGRRPALNYTAKCFRQLITDQEMDKPCGAGRGTVGINYKGDMFPCHRFVQHSEWAIGNVWDGITDTEKKKIFEDYDVNKTNPKCMSCDNKFCGGTCYAAAYAKHGSIYAIEDSSCLISKKQFDNSKKLYEEYKDNETFKDMYDPRKKTKNKNRNKRMSKDDVINRQNRDIKKLKKQIEVNQKEINNIKLTLSAVLKILEEKKKNDSRQCSCDS